MAETDFGALNDLRKRGWSLRVSRQGRDQNFHMSNWFMGANTDDMSRPVSRITELTETERGTECVLPLVQDLTGGGVVDDNELEKNEEALFADTQIMRLSMLRNGVKSRGAMSEQATVLRFRSQGTDALAFWLADSIDELLFLTQAGRAFSLNTDGSARANSQWPQLRFAADVKPASANRVIYAGTATSEGSLTANDKMTWDLVIKAKAFAKRKRIKPIRMGGKDFYILVLSTEQCRDLETSSDYKSLHAQAMPRGLDNPLFTNAKRVISDVVIYDHQKQFNTLGLASGSKWGAAGAVDGAQAALLGAQALGYAEIKKGNMFKEASNTDYDNRPGMAVGRILSTLKPQYKSRYDAQLREDYSIVTLKTAAAA